MNTKLLTIFLTVFLDLVGFGLIIPLSPYLARQFSADPLQIGFLMAIYSGMQFLFSPIWGSISDRVGRKPILIICLIGTSFGHFAFAFADQLIWLFVARAVAGLFSGSISTAMAYVADVTTDSERSKGMGLMGAAFGLGFILGPALGAVFAIVGSKLGDHAPFGPQFSAIAAGVLCFCNGVAAIWFLQESLTLENRKTSLRRSRFASLKKYFKAPVVAQLIGTSALSVLAMALIENQLFLFVDDRFNWSLAKASLGFAYVGLIMAFTQGYLIRRVLEKWGEKRVLLLGLFMTMLAFSMMAMQGPVAWLAVAVTLLGFGVGFVNPSVNGSISLMADKSEQGEIMGLSQGLSALARVVGPLVGGWAYKSIGMHSPFAMAAIIVSVGLLLIVSVFSALPSKAVKHT
jgi:DHA1 family tetracycline resistance protein-like MFS transporter